MCNIKRFCHHTSMDYDHIKNDNTAHTIHYKCVLKDDKT